MSEAAPIATVQFTRAPISGTPTGSILRNRMILTGAALAGTARSISLSAQAEATLPDGTKISALRPDDPEVFLPPTQLFHPTRLRLRSGDCRDAVALAKAAKADVAILEGIEMLDLAGPLRHAGLRVILDMHNIESSLMAQTFRAGGRRGPATLLRHWLKVSFAKRDERRALETVDEIWVCSAEDAAALGSAKCVVIGNPVPDSAAFDLPIEAARYAHCTAIFAGMFNYPPNRQAIEVLLDDITPQLARAGLKPRVTIAGRNPKRLFLDHHRPPQTAIISDPETMLPHLADAGYCILPINFGGGTRLKVLEAFAAGAVTIATPLSVAGCGAVAGEHYVAAETPEGITAALRGFTKNPAAAVEMAERARAHARRSFHQDHLTTRVRDHIQAPSTTA